MRRIEISEMVWEAIAVHGKFGETEDDALRRILKLPAQDSAQDRATAPSSQPESRMRPMPLTGSARSRSRLATTRMSSFVQNGSLVVAFAGGQRKSFTLPDRKDKLKVRQVRDEAVSFAQKAGASYGQEMAVKKALTESGYHLVK